MLKKYAIKIISALIYCYFAVLLCLFFSGNKLIVTFIIPVFLLFFLVVMSDVIWKWRSSREAGKVVVDNKQPIRFDGNHDQVEKAAQIGKAHGWAIEILPQAKSGQSSIRLTQIEGASTSKELLQALFKARIAWSVRA